jgi:homoprotocatechuate degradation regulator HpaR
MRSLEQSLPLRLLQAREVVMDLFRPHLHAHGVTEQQWRVLRALAETSGLDAGMLARHVCLLMPSLSRILRDLSKAGLLTRRQNPADRRVAIVSLTPKGFALFEEMSRESELVYARVEKAIGSSVYNKLMKDLGDLIEILGSRRVALSVVAMDQRRRSPAAKRS